MIWEMDAGESTGRNDQVIKWQEMTGREGWVSIQEVVSNGSNNNDLTC